VIFKRWAVRYKHDKSPLDAGTFAHKNAAVKCLEALANKDKLEVVQIAMMSVEFADHLAKQLSEL
jgi:hypothetical protein